MDLEIVLEILQLVTIVGTIIGSVIGIVKKLAKPVVTIRNNLESLDEKIAKLERYSHRDYMRDLKLTIMSEEMPIEERLEAGERYLKEGGNGPIKVKYHMLQEEYQKEQEE